VRFPRAYRLTRRREFERVLRQRSMRVAKGPFVAIALANAFGAARLGMIIGKRHLSRAVDRNRVKRVIRESFRCHHDALPHLDIVIQLASSGIEKSDARGALDDIWQRLGEVRS
jgi:ribonuclease P protein component